MLIVVQGGGGGGGEVPPRPSAACLPGHFKVILNPSPTNRPPRCKNPKCRNFVGAIRIWFISVPRPVGVLFLYARECEAVSKCV